MPWGWECRTKLLKQNPVQPTVPRKGGEVKSPAPNYYEPPQILGGKGYDKIKRAPAYTFGHMTPVSLAKPAAMPYAPQIDIKGMDKKGGPYKITHGVVSPQLEPPGGFRKIPGPGAHSPDFGAKLKRPPAYTCRPAAKQPYEPSDMWTPPPNLYWPPLTSKKPPAYTLVGLPKDQAPSTFPGPCQHEPNFNYVKKTKPAFSFGYPFRPLRKSSDDSPAPNSYCEKKYMYAKKHIPAPSFGIRHTPYLGKEAVYEKPSDLDIALNSV